MAAQDPTETSPLLRSSSDLVNENSSSTSSAALPAPTPSDEESLLRDNASADESPTDLSHGAIMRIISVLMIAVFIFNADHSLVLATHPTIASDFNALEWSSWLFTSFGLAGAALQPIFGKLSDIYGRKPIILILYAGFAIGCIIVAVAGSMLTVILGRVLSGGVGTSMTVLVTILISDIVPIRESGTWRAYVNIAATTGRSLGGPLGGWLADAVGWRWSFGIQAPMFALAFLLCWRILPGDLSSRKPERANEPATASSKLARIDFLGATVLAVFILLLLLPLELGGNDVPWSHPLIPALLAGALVCLALFIQVEKRYAKEPIMDLSVFADKDAVLVFLVMGLQAAAQLGMMFLVPLYFQVTQKVSSSIAGAHLFPSVAGNAVGGVVAGILIKRTGKYKWLVYLGTICSGLCYVLLFTRWHGDTNWLESFYIFPGGLGMGMAYTVLFVGTQATVKPEQISAAVSTLFLSTAVGTILGVAAVTAVMKLILQKVLEVKLQVLGLDAATRIEIISKAVSNVEYVLRVKGKIAEAIVESYVEGLLWAHGLSLVFVLVGFFLALFIKERKLRH